MNLDERLLRQARQSRLALFLTLAFGFTAGILTVIQAGILSRVIDRVFLDGQNFTQVIGLLQALLVFFALRAGLAWASEIASHSAARRVKLSLRDQLYRRILQAGPGAINRESTGELSSVLLEGVETLEAYYSQYLPQLGLAVLVPLTILVFVFPIDWISGIVLLLTAPLIPVFMILIGNLGQTLAQRQWQSLSRMNAYFLDVLQGLTVLKLFGRSQAQSVVIDQVSDRYRQTTMNVLRVTFLSALVLEMAATLSTAVVAVEVGLRLLYGRLEFEQAFLILLLAPEFYLPLRLLGMRFHAGMSGAAAASRIFAVLQDQPTAVKTPAPGDGTIKPSKSNDRQVEAAPSERNVTPSPITSIRFENIDYAYDGDRSTIQGVSFEIKAGQKIALVGPSGGGKSTIAGLLLGFIQPGSGRILINGLPMQEFSLSDWRGQIAWVSQKPYLFHNSLAENIRLGKENASLNEVVQAAKLAQADEFIRELPQGYDTLVGEQGIRLSAGQAQRVALARAFLKDAPVVILDEASASLDPETEGALQSVLDSLLVGRTTLIIAHRLNTVFSADRLLVLDQGVLVEAGSHDELMAGSGLYARMVHAYVNGEYQPLPQSASIGLSGDDGEIEPELSPQPASMGENANTELGRLTPSVGAGKEIVRLLRLVTPYKGKVGLSILTGFATIASGIGLMATSAYLISVAALQPSIAALQVAIVGVRFFGISRGIFRYLERYFSHQATFLVLGRLRVSFYQALEPLVPARLINIRSGDLLARISGDIESLQNFYVRALAPPVIAGLIGILAVGLTWYWAGITPASGLLFFMVLAGLGTPLLTHWLSRKPGVQVVGQRAALSAELVDGIQGLPELLVYGQGQHQAARLDRANRRLAESQSRLAWINGLQSALVLLFSQLGMWIVLVLSIPFVVASQIDGVYLAVLTMTALTCFEAIQPLPLAAQVLESSRQAARRLFEVVDAQPEVLDTLQPTPIPSEFSVRVSGLSFAYPLASARNMLDVNPWCNSPEGLLATPAVLPSIASVTNENLFAETLDPLQSSQALVDLSFELSGTTKLALVGPSGAGKSTILGILLRFWEYKVGSVYLAGEDYHKYRHNDLRSFYGIVSQNTFLFHTSIRENLLLARPRASQAELEDAVERVQLKEWIATLPNGMDTYVGERGLRISAGQRQRLAIARAILKDAQVLLLDEPTANLDSMTEQAVLQALLPIMRQRAVLYITHRLVGMEEMDEILVLRKGRVIERGRHDSLLAMKGYYRKLYDIQRQALNFD